VLPLWLVAELAIIACDVAETVGAAVALHLLLHVPLWMGVLLSSAVVLGYFVIERSGPTRLERLVAISMLAVAGCLIAQLYLARPDWAAVARGFAPTVAVFKNRDMLWLVAGIVGATVMPHNLFLHSALLKQYAASERMDRLVRIASIDTIVCLMFAMLINIGLMLLAAAALHGSTANVGDLAQAQRQLAPALGATWPGILFAAALLCCGVNSMVSGTMAGQAVAEGFLRIRLTPLWRAALTRALALGPALMAVQVAGAEGSTAMLVGSQVLLSMTLPLALLPMLWFASSPRLMKRFELGGAVKIASWGCALLVVTINGLLVWQAFLAR
jgi:manganese transport protein